MLNFGFSEVAGRTPRFKSRSGRIDRKLRPNCRVVFPCCAGLNPPSAFVRCAPRVIFDAIPCPSSVSTQRTEVTVLATINKKMTPISPDRMPSAAELLIRVNGPVAVSITPNTISTSVPPT